MTPSTLIPQATSPAAFLQRRLGLALRDKVAGTDAVERAAEIWGKEGPRWFGPSEPIARVHANASMYAGGLAALLLQALHPKAMAGVAGHSGYRGDPWGRLQRTSLYIATTTFGTIDDATMLAEHVKVIHQRVRGKDHRGRPYRASDPELLRWVHDAEISSFLAAYQAYSGHRLSPREADIYVDQTRLASELLGATGLPRSAAELDAQMTAYRRDLEVTEAAKDVARFILRDPPVAGPLRPGYGLLVGGALAIVPPWAREMLELPLPTPLTSVARGAGLVGTAGVRWALSAVSEGRDPANAY